MALKPLEAQPSGRDIGDQRPARFLGCLPEPVREELLSMGSPQQYSYGEKILVEGAGDDYLVLLETGRVKVSRKCGNGRETLLAIRVGGDVVGEMAVIDDGPRSATVTACDNLDALVVEGGAVRRFLGKHPEAAMQIARLIKCRLHAANSWRLAYGEFPVPVRLARVLAELAEEHGQVIRSHILIGIDISQDELAGFIGAKTTTVQKKLAEFRDHGILRTGARRTEVMKPDLLRAIGRLPAIGR